ncbi:MAG TPA: MBL fold metallo-hydrolase [Solirubrobacteraceae bacterium]|nr:MBL fold metallo-hydrolase [Solirubrobacteraceae bacterium]
MLITVLGKSPSWEDAGGACTAYLVQEGDYTLLLDCGTGSFAKLRLAHDYLDVDAVLITHLHSDHFFDLVPFSYGLTLTSRTRRAEPPRLCAPPGAREVFRQMLGAWGKPDLIESAFALEEYDPAAGLELGPLRARLREVPHFTRTFAVDLSDGRGRLTFGADCGPNDALVELARGTDVLLIEAALTEPEDPSEPRGHLTPREAGEHGRRAGAKRLVVTHFSDEVDREWLRSEAEAGCGGPVELAAEGAQYTI